MHKNEIMKLVNQNNGYLYSKIIKENGIYTSSISRLEKEGLFTKIARGIYISQLGVEDEFFIKSIKYTK